MADAPRRAGPYRGVRKTHPAVRCGEKMDDSAGIEKNFPKKFFGVAGTCGGLGCGPKKSSRSPTWGWRNSFGFVKIAPPVDVTWPLMKGEGAKTKVAAA